MKKTQESMNKLEKNKQAALIAMVRDNQLLWDSTSVHYRNNKKKTEVWQRIADELNVPPFWAQKYYKNLRDRYTKERKKESTKWEWFYEFLFLEKTDSSKLNTSGVPIDDYDDEDDSNADNFDFTMDESLITPKIELNEHHEIGEDDPLKNQIQQSSKEEFIPNQDDINGIQVESHEEDIFCDWIRTNLSSIPDPLLRMPLYCNIVREIQSYMQKLRDDGKM